MFSTFLTVSNMGVRNVANHKSAQKRSKQAIKRTIANKTKKTETRTVVKRLRLAIEEKDKEQATTLFNKVQSMLGKLARSGVIKPKNASRKTSRLATQVQAL